MFPKLVKKNKNLDCKGSQS